MKLKILELIEYFHADQTQNNNTPFSSEDYEEAIIELEKLVNERNKFAKMGMATNIIPPAPDEEPLGSSILLLNEFATVTTCHIFTKDSSKMTKEADVVVVGVGVPRLVKENWVREGAVVIDVGINVDKDGNMCGDTDFDNIVDKAAMITPVPGGVGSVTTSILAKHVIKACKQQNHVNSKEIEAVMN